MRALMQRLTRPADNTLRDVKGTDGKMYKLSTNGKIYQRDERTGSLRCVHRLGQAGVELVATEAPPPKP